MMMLITMMLIAMMMMIMEYDFDQLEDDVDQLEDDVDGDYNCGGDGVMIVVVMITDDDKDYC
jgi:hypothetical protein